MSFALFSTSGPVCRQPNLHDFSLRFPLVSQAVMGNMHEEMKKARLPIVHYGVDLWTCKTSSRKYIDVHVFYVDSTFQLKHALLAVSVLLAPQ